MLRIKTWRTDGSHLITSTTQSRNKHLYLGYAYVKNKDLADGWVSFECERRRNYKGCTGRIKANGQQVVVVTNHTHTPNPARNEALKTVVAMKEMAQNTLEQPQQIIGNSVAGIQDAVAVELPNMNTIRRNIRRQEGRQQHSTNTNDARHTTKPVTC